MSSNEYVVAKEPLYIGTALAHNAGDLVPAENVTPNDWDALVAKQGTKAADEAGQG